MPIARLTFLLCLVLPAGSAHAQQPQTMDPGSALATRDHLQATLAQIERGNGAGAEATMIRSRLASGDFRAGDRIVVHVDGEPELTDTFTVGAGPALPLPRIGDVPLHGVLRAELQDRLTAAIARFVRGPVVRSRPLIRVLVEGEVAHPGFYPVSPDLPLAEVVTVAGGLTQRAKVRAMRVERGPDVIWGGVTLEHAIGRGATLDQLSLQAGDRVVVPGRGDAERTVRILGVLVGIPLTVFTVTRLSR